MAEQVLQKIKETPNFTGSRDAADDADADATANANDDADATANANDDAADAMPYLASAMEALGSGEE
ncbi:hypothetical protein NFJ02_40g105510 [Pycnococcus provasolii]